MCGGRPSMPPAAAPPPPAPTPKSPVTAAAERAQARYAATTLNPAADDAEFQKLGGAGAGSGSTILGGTA